MPKRGKYCQSSHRHSPSGEERQEWGKEAGPVNTRSCEKRSLLSNHPPISIHSYFYILLSPLDSWERKHFKNHQEKKVEEQRNLG